MDENPYQSPHEKPIDHGRSAAVNYALGSLCIVFGLLGFVFKLVSVWEINEVNPRTTYALVLSLAVIVLMSAWEFLCVISAKRAFKRASAERSATQP
jgi:uncharacterized membrane protein